MDSSPYCPEAEYLQKLADKMTNDHSLFEVVCALNRHYREGDNGSACYHPENLFIIQQRAN